VLNYLKGLGPLLRIILKHPVHQGDGLGTSPCDQLLQRDALVVGHLDHLSIGEAFGVRPVIVTGSA